MQAGVAPVPNLRDAGEAGPPGRWAGDGKRAVVVKTFRLEFYMNETEKRQKNIRDSEARVKGILAKAEMEHRDVSDAELAECKQLQ
jgi:hypothetical protein